MTAAIVCGIDESGHARTAAQLAARLSERLRLRLILLHTMPVPVPSFMPAWAYPAPLDRRELRETARRAGERLLTEVREEIGAPDAAGRVEDGAAAERLCATATDEDAAFIVVGTQGEGALAAGLLGSVSLATIRSAPCPVVVVPPAAAGEGRVTLAGERVVCGVEGDEGPAHVAARLARELDLSLMLAHAAPPQDEDVKGGTIGAVPLVSPGPGDDALDEARATLDAAVDAVRGEATRLDAPRMLAGNPARQLSRLAEEEQAALVVVGTRGRGALGARLLGSVARDLACHGRAPVVVCPENDTVAA